MKLLAIAAAVFGTLASAGVLLEPVRGAPAATTVTNSPKPTIPPGLDLSQVYITGISYGGTGCPQGSVGISLSQDRKTFTLIFDAYVASIGPGVPITETRKNCQINVGLHYPGGFQYSIFTSDYRGFIDLEKGVTAMQKATYYFAGSSNQASTETKWSGPVSQDYLIHDEIPFTSTVWSPCGSVEALNINSQIRLDNTQNKKGIGYLSTDSIDGHVTFIVGVIWQPCK